MVTLVAPNFAPGPIDFNHPNLTWEKRSYGNKEYLSAYIPSDREEDFVEGEGRRTKCEFYKRGGDPKKENVANAGTVSNRSSC